MKKSLVVFLLSFLLAFGLFCLAEADSNSNVKLSVEVAEVINFYILGDNLIIETNTARPISVIDKQKNSLESFQNLSRISVPVSSDSEYTIVGGI